MRLLGRLLKKRLRGKRLKRKLQGRLQMRLQGRLPKKRKLLDKHLLLRKTLRPMQVHQNKKVMN